MTMLHPLPAPRITPESAEYWAAAAQGRLLIKVCRACGGAHHYPRANCPFCLGGDTEWKTCSGEGVVYAATVIRRGPGAGLAPAFVTLDEGPTIQTGLVECDPATVPIGARVRVVFKPTDGGPPAPMFTPVKD